MTHERRELARVRNPILLIASAAWTLLLLEPRDLRVLAHCPAIGSPTMPISSSFQGMLAGNSSTSLAAGWALMLVAMMLPVLIPPVCHIRLRSFARRRVRATMLFVTGYAAIWMAVGGVSLAIELPVRLLAAQSYLPAAGVIVVAFIWQCSPLKQRCLNRCHAHPGLAAFGAAADIDAVGFGITHGIWCAGSCWAWMLSALLLPRGHVAAMATVAILIFCERLEQPRPPSWGPRGLGRAIRILVARVQTGGPAHTLRS